MPIRKPQGDPHKLLDLARSHSKGEAGGRRLTIDERIWVLFWMKLEGKVFTTRQMAALFGVSHNQIAKDLREVDDLLVEHHRRNGRNADRLVYNYGLQFDRVLRSLWEQYEEERAPLRKALIAGKAFHVSDAYLNRMQELGVVPRAPRHLEPGAVLLTLPEARELARAILGAAARAGVVGPQLEAFRRELALALRAGMHATALLEAC